MDNKTSSSWVPGPDTEEASNHDELFMKQSMLFSDTLKDLKSLRKQLYSAAEYFEKSYSKEDQKQIVVETLKDYAVKALINTIDHLGSVAYKVNNLFDNKADEISALELRFSCLEQRRQTCQEYINHGGLSQQFLVVQTPKYHKRYIFPAEETLDTKSNVHRRSFSADYNSHQFENAVRATIRGTSPSISRGNSRLQSPQLSSKQGNFVFAPTSTKKRADTRTSSPQRFQLIHTGTFIPRRSTSPNNPNAKRRYPSEPRRSVSLSTYPGRDRGNEIEQYSSKSKRLFKALLSMRKSKRDRTFYKYLDEV
ncbi:protein ABIL2 isoform X2 [Ricinus communis]|uniref:Protein ABIL2, putative n=1 Tax=Ricinus communis TaxID=3988 RepID=B9RYN8_RICCO|nr:protein ABIL2 isoform X2 [Ricinus communis]EEF43390.1 Protein ABIL2, putative [Ricinus communis]|eukprot:XP_002518857.1 protein ABIL2 isoform X2 [Ricinus communis]